MHQRKSARARSILLVVGCCALLSICGRTMALKIGVDAVHGFDSATIPGNGSSYDIFRSTITSAGHTIVPLTSFSAAELSGVDAIILDIAYSQNALPYTAAQMTQIRLFAATSVFVSDASMWTDPEAGSDFPIGFGSNQRLLSNAVGYIAAGHGALFMGEDGTGFDVANFNTLVAPYGIQYAAAPTDADGRLVGGFVAHTVTTGVTQVGVDFQLPMTITSPALDLTVGGGQDNVLAVSTPEPALGLAALAATFALNARRRGPR